MNIVLCSDEHYAPYCAVVMVSVLLHASNPQAIRFFILTPGLVATTSDALQAMVKPYGAQLRIIPAASKLADDNIDLQRFGPSSVMRLSMHDYLPSDCYKAIYLDSDLLVLADIQELWETDLENRAVAAVTDLCSPQTFTKRATRWINYCNSGVLVVDLEQWRGQHLGENALAFIRKHASELVYFDQDAINAVLEGRWKQLDLAWNFQTTAYHAYENKYDYLEARQTELERAVQHPNIVHFIGDTKPWNADCQHPLQGLFADFSKYTPWPIYMKELRAQLSWTKRLRLVAKTLKISRRRKLLRYKKAIS